MAEGLFELPAKPFFGCDEDGFVVVDGSEMRTVGAVLSIEPLLKLIVAPGNVFEQRPLRVTDQDAHNVTVECEGGETVYLDFYDLKARKEGPEGEFVYRGPLDEGNDALGIWRGRRPAS